MQPHDNPSASLANWCLDCGVTLLCWAWFLFGFLLFFSWRYAAAALLAKDPETAFQRLNSRFFQILFRIIRATSPQQKLRLDSEAKAIRSAVIVCNHLSYLDPLLLIALFPRHRTIVKTRFFRLPIFGRVIRKSGYLPAAGEGRFAPLLLRQMETMEAYLKTGGILFIFPEGTRSRDGRPGTMRKGALNIARMAKAPVYVLRIENTDRLFAPGRFLFKTREKNTISIKMIGRSEPDSPSFMAEAMRQMQEACER